LSAKTAAENGVNSIQRDAKIYLPTDFIRPLYSYHVHGGWC